VIMTASRHAIAPKKSALYFTPVMTAFMRRAFV
jgi:hypothetical protein